MNKDNSNLLSSILDVQDNLVILLNLKGEIIRFNKACENITGYSFSEVKNKKIWKVLIKKDEIEATKDIFENLKAKNFPNEHQNYLKTKDGNLRLIFWTNNVLLDENNEAEYIVATGKDITKKMWNEKVLKKSQEIANLGNWELDLKNNKLFWSDEIYRIFGLKPQEFEANYEAFLDVIHPEDREKVDKAYNSSIKENKDKYEIEHRIIKQDSGEIRYIKEKCEHIKNDNGKIVRSLGIVQDITERKQLEKNLKEKNILFDSILESIQDGISVLNPDLTIRYTNSTMEKWYKEQLPLKDKKCFKAYHDKNSSCENCPTLRCLESGKVEKEIISGHKDSEIDYIEVFSYPIWDEDNENITGAVEFVRDISARVKRKEKIEKQRQRMKYILEGTEAGTWEWNIQTGETVFNEKWAEMIGYTLEEISPTTIETWKKFSHPEDLEKSEEKLENHFNGKIDQYKIEIRMRHKEGHWIWVLDQGKVISWTDAGKPLKMFGVHLNITERKKKEKKIEYLSYRDQLTDLYNRRFFEEEMKRLNTKRQLPISIIMADVNGLKIINDSYGHQKGDELLIKTAEILKSSLRAEDVLVRHGGDEFAVLLPQTTRKEAQKIIKRIKEKTENTKQNTIPISIGIGMAVKRKAEGNIEDTLKKADNAMYKNKLSNSKSTKNKIIQNLLNTLETKSSETKEHALRMEKLAHELGKKINLSNSELNRLSLLAALHDIGKTTISKNILNKAGDLNEGEWEVIKEHPETGYKIASASDEFALVAKEILYHHEHWDGGGYPKGLAAEEIPFLARIISIVDAYDVMTNDRPYSKAISNKKALAEIKDCAGNQFDPDLAAEFIKLMTD